MSPHEQESDMESIHITGLDLLLVVLAAAPLAAIVANIYPRRWL